MIVIITTTMRMIMTIIMKNDNVKNLSNNHNDDNNTNNGKNSDNGNRKPISTAIMILIRII